MRWVQLAMVRRGGAAICLKSDATNLNRQALGMLSACDGLYLRQGERWGQQQSGADGVHKALLKEPSCRGHPLGTCSEG